MPNEPTNEPQDQQVEKFVPENILGNVNITVDPNSITTFQPHPQSPEPEQK